MKTEWPLSENAKEEDPPRDDEPFDFNAKPQKFYLDIETVGSLTSQEVVMTVNSYYVSSFSPVPMLLSRDCICCNGSLRILSSH